MRRLRVKTIFIEPSSQLTLFKYFDIVDLLPPPDVVQPIDTVVWPTVIEEYTADVGTVAVPPTIDEDMEVVEPVAAEPDLHEDTADVGTVAVPSIIYDDMEVVEPVAPEPVGQDVGPRTVVKSNKQYSVFGIFNTTNVRSPDVLVFGKKSGRVKTLEKIVEVHNKSAYYPRRPQWSKPDGEYY